MPKFRRREKNKFNIGDRFGRWVVLGESFVDEKSYRKYPVKCDCGVIKNIRKDTLANGESTSCGCYASEQVGLRSTTHGLSTHPLYDVYIGMIRRCYNETAKDYVHYGGRGIEVDDLWLGSDGMVKFFEDMYPSFVDGLELDRIDVNGDYTKENCRWATRRTQVINRRPFGTSFDTHYLTFNDKTLCMSEWEDEVGIPATVISDRITTLGWSVEKTLTTPLKPKFIVVEIGQKSFRLKDIFKNSSNAIQQARRRGYHVVSYLRAIFKSPFTIHVVSSCGSLNVESYPEMHKDIATSFKLPDLSENFIKELIALGLHDHIEEILVRK